MKKGRLLGLMALGCMFLALIVPAKASFADPNAWVEAGKTELFTNGNLLMAHFDFQQALIEDNTHPRANFWYGLTRVAVGMQTNDMINLLTAAGFTKNDGSPLDQDALNPFNLDVKPPLEIPADSPTLTDVQNFFKGPFLEQIDIALNMNFAQLDDSFIDYVDMQRGMGLQELDYGEVLACKTLFNFLSAYFHSFAVYDFDNLDIDDVLADIDDGMFVINGLLANYTNLLLPLADAGSQLALAGPSFEAMLTDALEAIDFIRNETDDQSDDLITIDEFDPDIADKIEKVQDTLNSLLDSLDGPTQIVLPEDEIQGGPIIEEVQLDLSEFFDDGDPLNLRELLPSFRSDDKFVANSLPDPTVGGLFPDLTQADWNYFMNLGPKLIAPMEDQEVNEGELLEFIVMAKIPKKGPETTYTAEDLPAGATFINQTFSWRPDYGQAGIYQVTFIASTGEVFDAKTINITVKSVNSPPVLSPVGDKTVKVGQRLQFRLKASDADVIDNRWLRYYAVDLPKGAYLSRVTGKFSWQPTSSQLGVYKIKFYVKDLAGATDEQTVSITVIKSAFPWWRFRWWRWPWRR